MKIPALLMLSALVALGHWLLLAPESGTLAQLASTLTGPYVRPGIQSAPATSGPLRALETRRIESPSPPPAAKVLQAVSTEPWQAASRNRTPPPAAPPRANKAVFQPETRTETGPSLETEAPPNADTIATTATAVATFSPDAAAADSTDQALAPQKEEAASPPSPLSPPLAAQLIARLQLPKPARLNYDIVGQSRGLSYRASGILDWQRDGNHYDARLTASIFFLGNRILSSQGEVTADGLAPTRFSDKARSEQAAHFEASKGKITFSANTPDAPWQRGAQDRLSVFFQLAGMLAGQPERLAPGTQIPVYTASARSADTWAFLVDDIENLSLPAGTMPTVKLTRQNKLEHDQLVEVWFAPSMSYWPVRIKLTQRNGDFVDQQLASVTTP